MLADKVSGNQVGIWLLLPELLRLGVWELLCAWAQQASDHLEPRLALHLINESALCLRSLRWGRSLSQKGFELANGLPFVPSDSAIHHLLDQRTVQQAQALQIGLGKMRRAGRHFRASLLALDPHRLVSFSKRQMRRHRFEAQQRGRKMAQTFFLIDCHTHQPLCFTLASSATTATHAAQQLLAMAAQILERQPPLQPKPLVVADKEHFSQQLFEAVIGEGFFDLLTPVPNKRNSAAQRAALDQLALKEQWAGFATAQRPFEFNRGGHPPLVEYIQRTGGASAKPLLESFVCTRSGDEVQMLTRDYPDRWHIEEFFKHNQALGWDRAGTLNQHIRYGHMTFSLIAQAAISQLRQRLGAPFQSWDAPHLARQLFTALEGDVRLRNDTIVVTYYNPPNQKLLREHYERLPEKLQADGVNPHIPWLYDFKLDFRFK